METTFGQDGTGRLMTIRMTLPDAKTREAMLATGMEHGMEASYPPNKWPVPLLNRPAM